MWLGTGFRRFCILNTLYIALTSGSILLWLPVPFCYVKLKRQSTGFLFLYNYFQCLYLMVALFIYFLVLTVGFAQLACLATLQLKLERCLFISTRWYSPHETKLDYTWFYPIHVVSLLLLWKHISTFPPMWYLVA